MRVYKTKRGVTVKAEMLTTETLETLETACGGKIRGVRLSRAERCIDFWQSGEEFRLEMGQVLVCFENQEERIFQVWKGSEFRAVFVDVDDTPC